MMKKYILIFFSLLAPFTFAANETVPRDRIIQEVTVYGDLVVVKFGPAFENTQNCSSGSMNKVQLNLIDDPEGVMFATILAAASSSKETGFGIGGCNGQYPRVYRVDAKY